MNIVQKLKCVFSEKYKRDYNKRKKFAHIMAVNNSIFK